MKKTAAMIVIALSTLALAAFLYAEWSSKAATESTVLSSDQAAMLARGDVAMGFDKDKIMHHFMSTSTGGRIMIVALNSSDTQTILQIKDHVADIEKEFSEGNFTKPFFIHDQQVPGTDVMAEKKDLIRYSVEQLSEGAVLTLTTDDAELIQAIQQFMQFQGQEHQGH
ncbi:MAG TPA: hypothetical protein VJZ68_07240 [Nitrososphaera sp.]|nr:hypothetical protein [Nitrososphaera sp.]